VIQGYSGLCILLLFDFRLFVRVTGVFGSSRCFVHICHRPEIQHSLIQRMSSGRKLSTEEEERTEILLDHIAKNTRLGIDGKLRDDGTRPTVTVMTRYGYFSCFRWMRPSINQRYYQYCCVGELAAFLDACSNVFAVLTAILESSFTSSFLCSIIVFNASIFQ
jgi:hypothetical protein